MDGEPLATTHQPQSTARYLLKGVDPFDPSMTIEKLFGPDLKGRMLQEAIWTTYHTPMWFSLLSNTCCVFRIKT